MSSWSILGGCWGAEGFWDGLRNPLLSWYFSSTVGSQTFWHQGLVLQKSFFYGLGWEGWFWDDSRALHLLCTLFLLLLHQLQLRSSVIRSRRLGPPTLIRVLPRKLSGKESTCQCRSCGFHPWVGKIPWWRRAWQPTPVFLPGEFHGQRSLVDHSPWGCKESDTTEHAISNRIS